VSTTILPPMSGMFTKNWGLMLLRGIVAILFGILAITRPVKTLGVLVLLFGAYALVDGFCALFSAISGWKHREDRWLLLLEAFIGIGVGFATLHAPFITAVALIFFIAAWALGTGVLKIVAAIRLRKEIAGEPWLVLGGIASVIFAFLVMLRPGVGALAMTLVIGWYAIFIGVMEVLLSFKLRGLRRLEYVPGGTYKRAA